jgi:hypothetical protein
MKISIKNLAHSCNYSLTYFLKLLKYFDIKSKIILNEDDLIKIRSSLLVCRNLTYKKNILLHRVNNLLQERVKNV